MDREEKRGLKKGLKREETEKLKDLHESLKGILGLLFDIH